MQNLKHLFTNGKQIAEGWGQLLLSELDVIDVPAYVIKRIRHCSSCTLLVDGRCSSKAFGLNIQTGKPANGCNCVMKAAVFTKSKKCPLSKW